MPPSAAQAQQIPEESATAPSAQEPTETSRMETGTSVEAAGLSGLAHRMAEAESEAVSSFGPKLESIILVDPNMPEADDDYGPMPEIPARPETSKSEESKPTPASFTPATPPVGGWGSRKERTATSTGWIPRRPPPPSRKDLKKKSSLGWLWSIIVLILLAVLAVQAFFHFRDKIAASYPESRPYLAQMCDVLGCALSLPKDTKQVLILGSDLQTENENNMSLEITLANRAAHAMAWPVLELTLTDVEDQPIARRMFAPSEYLPTNKMEAAGIQALSEIPFNLQLQSKGLKAAGYRLRMFY